MPFSQIIPLLPLSQSLKDFYTSVSLLLSCTQGCRYHLSKFHIYALVIDLRAYLIDRVPDELWNEVRDIVQETGIKTIPMEKKGKKAKWLSGEDLHIAIKRREVKSKGEKERYKHLNAEFQRIARRDKKAFFGDQ